MDLLHVIQKNGWLMKELLENQLLAFLTSATMKVKNYLLAKKERFGLRVIVILNIIKMKKKQKSLDIPFMVIGQLWVMWENWMKTDISI